MKTNFLKTSLFAFAFALAIVTSFAFSPAFNNAEDLVPVTGYEQTTSFTPCINPNTGCTTTNTGTVCTNGTTQVYGITTMSLGHTSCLDVVYEP